MFKSRRHCTNPGQIQGNHHHRRRHLLPLCHQNLDQNQTLHTHSHRKSNPEAKKTFYCRKGKSALTPELTLCVVVCSLPFGVTFDWPFDCRTALACWMVNLTNVLRSAFIITLIIIIIIAVVVIIKYKSFQNWCNLQRKSFWSSQINFKKSWLFIYLNVVKWDDRNLSDKKLNPGLAD